MERRLHRTVKIIFELVILTLISGCTANYFERGGKLYHKRYIGLLFEKRVNEVEGVDISTFVNINGNYGMDKNAVYYRSSLIEGADPGSFEVLDYFVAVDNRQVYLNGKPVPGSHGPSFEDLDGGFWRDRNDIYWNQKPLLACDRTSFEVISFEKFNYWGRDKKCFYSDWGDKIPVKDPDSYQFLGGNYSKDKLAVYWMDSVIVEADPDSFYVPQGKQYGKDKNYCFLGAMARYCDIEGREGYVDPKLRGNGDTK